MTAVLMPGDMDSNDDYNSTTTQSVHYVAPYLCGADGGRVVGENQLFHSVSSQDAGKVMRFQVLEVEVMDDEDATECVVTAKTRIEVDPDGVEWTAVRLQQRQSAPVVFEDDVGFLQREWDALRQFGALSVCGDCVDCHIPCHHQQDCARNVHRPLGPLRDGKGASLRGAAARTARIGQEAAGQGAGI